MMLRSTNPANDELIWEGATHDAEHCRAAVARAHAAFPNWARAPLEERIAVARRFADLLRADAVDWADLISRETGKLPWESRGEIAAMIAKVEISIAAQAERAGYREEATAFGKSVLRHRPHGVMAVLGPYNFPGHLPNGHIVPALLAGNCVVFKPSEETPAIGERMAETWRAAGLPADVLQVVQGDRNTGAALIDAPINGLLFTGSMQAGRYIRRALADRPDVIVALELGGNNPLVVWDGDPDAVARLVIHSAFITTGQRCSCARRLILPATRWGDDVVDALLAVSVKVPIGAWDEGEANFMGPLISGRAASAARDAAHARVHAGAKPLLQVGDAGRGGAFMSPGILDATGTALPDSEVFAPLLQLNRVADFDAAIVQANATAFGLTAGLVTSDIGLWDDFHVRVRAGVINWNRPTTGASSAMPFGGLGESGNHRPSAYYAADYCAFPTASFQAPALEPLAIAGMN